MTKRQIRRITGLLTDALTRMNAAGGPTNQELHEAQIATSDALRLMLAGGEEVSG